MAYISVSPAAPTDIFYPDDDGKPMAEGTKQYYWIVVLKENLEILLAANLDAFVAGDLLWYPIEGDNVTCTAPDVMVILERPKGHRRSYQQWNERDIPPTVVFEIMSPSNTQKEMLEKRSFYEQHGVDEFYIYDPDRNRITGYIRQGGELMSIVNLEGWVSPSLQIKFKQTDKTLEIYYPDGEKFLNTLELHQQATEAKQNLGGVTQERDLVIQERDLVTQERDLVTQERDLVTQERDLVTQERDRLLAQLRALGIDPT